MAKRKANDKKYKYITRTFTLPDGTRKYVYGKTKAEVEAKISELKAQVDAGVNINDDTTFGELAKLWMEQYKAPLVRPSTVHILKTQLNSWVMPDLASVRVRDVTQSMVQTIVAHMVKAQYTQATSIVSQLRDIMDLAVDLGCVAKNPVPRSLRLPNMRRHNDRVVLSPETCSLMMEALQPNTYERLFFILGLYTGMRRGEILALNWDCVNLESRTIRVRRSLVRNEQGFLHAVEATKTKDGLRDLPITEQVHDELKAWRASFGTNTTLDCPRSHGYLFARPDGATFSANDSERLSRRLRRVCASVDPDAAETFTAHLLRHTYVTRLFEAGLDIKEIQTLAGHANVQTTLGVYTHFDHARRQDSTFSQVRSILSDEISTNIIQFPGSRKTSVG